MFCCPNVFLAGTWLIFLLNYPLEMLHTNMERQKKKEFTQFHFSIQGQENISSFQISVYDLILM